MKKNNTMRVAAGLAIAALLSTCLVSGTYAKYTTRGNASDTARVAKFGVEVTSTGNSFATTYNNDAVKSGNTWNVVAPGTTGTFAAATLSGTPEVKVKVSNKLTTLDLSNWTVDGKFYCPIKVTVASSSTPATPTVIDGTLYEGKQSEFENAIKDAVAGYEATYNAGTNLATDASKVSPTITWQWAFDGDGDMDTKLGNAAANAATDKAAPTIKLEVTTIVEQLNN